MPDPNYPAGALEALKNAMIVASQGGGFDAAAVRAIDALAAMPPEDRAALARWLTAGRAQRTLDPTNTTDPARFGGSDAVK